MELELILKAAGVGMIVTVVCQILSKSGKDEQSGMVSLVGMIVMLLLVVEEMGGLIGKIKEIFGL
jgi:stage III sporulation protein AC